MKNRFKIFKKQENKNQKKGKFFRDRFLPFILRAGLVYLAVMGLFAFSGIPYLADATFIFATWPWVSILVYAVLAYLVYRFFPKNKEKWYKGFVGLTAAAFLVMGVRTSLYAFSPASRTETVRYADLVAGKNLPHESAEKGQFMAGAAKGDITPAQELFPLPLLSVLKFRDIHDPVYARVLAMSDGNQQYLYIALDMTLVPRPEESLAFLSQETGIPEEHILITATHTHGVSPISLMEYSALDNMKLDKWYGQIKNTLLTLVAEAQEKTVPAQYGYGEGVSRVNVNRDIVVGDKSILGRNLERYSDKTLRMVRIESLSGQPIALIANHATHGVVMNGAISGIGTSWTGDLPGMSAVKAEKELNGGLVFWSSSAAGDQNPRLTAQVTTVDDEGNAHHHMLGKNASSLLLEHLSDEHAKDILDTYKSITADKTDNAMKTALTTVTAEKVDGESKEFRLQVFTLGNIAFQGVNAEVVSSIGQTLFEQTPYENTIIMTMMNGYQNYIADEWEYDHDAFEQGNAGLKRGVGEKALVDGFAKIFEQLK